MSLNEICSDLENTAVGIDDMGDSKGHDNLPLNVCIQRTKNNHDKSFVCG